MFQVGEFYKTNNGDILRCIKGFDGQYDYTFRYDDGEFKAEYTDKNGETKHGLKVYPEIINVTSEFRKLANRLEAIVSKGDPQPVQTAETFTEAELGYIHSSLKCWKHEIKLDRSVDKHFDRVLDKIWRMQQLA